MMRKSFTVAELSSFNYIVWSFGEATEISDRRQELRNRNKPRRLLISACIVEDLIAMTRKNISAWRNQLRKSTDARIVNDLLASPSHLGLDCASRSPQCVGITPP
jgi:hypothetical protein